MLTCMILCCPFLSTCIYLSFFTRSLKLFYDFFIIFELRVQGNIVEQ